MAFAIDLDRGVIYRSHPSLNMNIYMYVDDPGVYYTAHGTPVDSALAEQAGFEVDKLDKKHKIKMALAEAQADVMARFGEAKPEVLMERDGFKVMDMGMGRCNVLGPDGDLLNKMPISKEQAEVLLKHLAPKAEKKGIAQPAA